MILPAEGQTATAVPGEQQNLLNGMSVPAALLHMLE
jgi:hypothetical protein